MRKHKPEPRLDGIMLRAILTDNRTDFFNAVHRLARLHFEYVPLNLGAKGERNE